VFLGDQNKYFHFTVRQKYLILVINGVISAEAKRNINMRI